MFDFFICLIMSMMLGCGMAILIVEKGKDWPIRPLRIRLQLILRKIYWKLPQMLFCTTCTSFWVTLISDIIICIIAFFLGGTYYFFWPFSGIIAGGMTWLIVEYLNSMDRDPNINVFIDKGDYDEN